MLLSCVMAAGLLAGCGGGSTSSSAESVSGGSADEGPEEVVSDSYINKDGPYAGTTLKLLVESETIEGNEGIPAIIKLAEQKLGVKIEIEKRVGGGDGDNIVKTRLASGDIPDIISYNSGSKLLALNPEKYFLDISDQDFAQTYDDEFKKSVSVNGKTFGVPAGSAQVGGILYNKKDYEELGLEIPKTWDDFIANCQKLKDAGKTAVIGAYGTSWTSQVLFLGDNYNVLAADPTFAEDFEAGKAKFADVPAATESFKKYEDLVDFYNKDYLTCKYEEGCDMLATGKGTHYIMLTMAVRLLEENYPDQMKNIGFFAIPGDDASSNGATVWYPGVWLINKNTEHKDACLALCKLWCSQEGIETYDSKVSPYGPSVIKGISYDNDPNIPDVISKDMQKYFDEGHTAPALEFLTSVKGPNCEQITQEVGSGQTTGEEAAAKYDDDCKKQALQLGLNWD